MTGGLKQSPLLAGLLLGIASFGFGCTTLQSTQLPPEELRDGIRNGWLVHPGDEIGVVTTDGREYVLTVLDTDRDAITGWLSGGESVALAIDDLVALRTHQTEEVRTALAVLAGIGAAGFAIIMLVLLALVATS